MTRDLQKEYKVKELSNLGWSSREIARDLNIGKSTVNDILARQELLAAGTPKIAVVDVETSAAKVYCFGRFDQNLSENSIAEEGGKILVACWKWLGDTNVKKLYMTPKEVIKGDDSRIVKELYKLYSKADAVVMHNGKKFDHKVIQTRGVFHNYGKLPTVKVLDTLQIAKRTMRLPSNKLDSIGAYFGLGRKVETSGIILWAKVQEGDAEAMEEMTDYCVQDVELLEAVFYRLAHLGIPGFNTALYFKEIEEICPVCSRTDIKSTGKYAYTAVGKFEEVQCQSCGSIHRRKTNLNSTTKRKSLLV